MRTALKLRRLREILYYKSCLIVVTMSVPTQEGKCYPLGLNWRSMVLANPPPYTRHKKIPPQWYLAIAKRAVERLEDKAQKVRKNALHLLTCLISHHPSPCLDEREFKKRFKQTYYTLKVSRRSDFVVLSILRER
jgi:hypothetical protein